MAASPPSPTSPKRDATVPTPPGGSSPPMVDRHGIYLSRRSMNAADGTSADLTPLMGMSSRNLVTGAIQIKNQSAFQDFVIVDLFSRKSISGSLEDLVKDPYLFRPVPMTYRTWIYHYEYIHNREAGKEENSTVRRALDYSCVDAPGNAGRWSPVMALVPMAMFISFVDDLLLLAPVLIMVWLGQSLANAMNTVSYYRYFRLATFPPRFAYYVFMLIRLVMTMGSQTGLGALGFLAALVCVFVDLAFGDIVAVRSFSLHCHYEIVSYFPQRIFVCRRVGAARLEEVFGHRGSVHEKVSGFAPWGKEHTLIADIQGVLMELRPMRRSDWNTLYDQNVVFSEALSYLSLDMFTHKKPDWNSVMEEVEWTRKSRAAMKSVSG